MLTTIAVLLIGFWLILASQEPVSDTLTLIVGIVALVLALVDLLGDRPWVSFRQR